jgi:hypothetical protein
MNGIDERPALTGSGDAAEIVRRAVRGLPGARSGYGRTLALRLEWLERALDHEDEAEALRLLQALRAMLGTAPLPEPVLLRGRLDQLARSVDRPGGALGWMPALTELAQALADWLQAGTGRAALPASAADRSWCNAA